jgi:prepilin-type N-terminal cleavage/methylation domain-containing protein
MKRHGHRSVFKQRGFSLIEMLLVVSILGIVTGGIFDLIDTAQQRARTEQVRVDNFQEARDFVDQFFRDINQIGYPSARMMDTRPPAQGTSWNPQFPQPPNPLYNDSRIATGLVRIDTNEIRFEGDTNGNGTVESVIYMINGSGTCPSCLQRSQADKITGDPITGQAQNWGTAIDNVVSPAVFSYFDTNGVKITGLPADTNSAAGRQTLASVKEIQISLTIRNDAVRDLKTNQPIETNFQSKVSLSNCSIAADGQPMSCK